MTGRQLVRFHVRALENTGVTIAYLRLIGVERKRCHPRADCGRLVSPPPNHDDRVKYAAVMGWLRATGSWTGEGA